MNKLKVIILIVLSVAAVAFAKITHLGIFIEVPVMSYTLYLIIKYRRSIALWFRKLPLPKILVALIAFFPFMLYEENINCLPTGCKLIPDTTQFLTTLIAVFLILIFVFKIKNFTRSVIVFSLFGLFIESFYGVGAAQLRALNPALFVFFVCWIFASYVYLAVIPFTILIEDKK